MSNVSLQHGWWLDEEVLESSKGAEGVDNPNPALADDQNDTLTTAQGGSSHIKRHIQVLVQINVCLYMWHGNNIPNFTVNMCTVAPFSNNWGATSTLEPQNLMRFCALRLSVCETRQHFSEKSEDIFFEG